MVTTYVSEKELAARYHTASVAYLYHNKCRTLMVEGGNFIKVRFCTDEDLYYIRETAIRLGVDKAERYCPSSWASLFHDAFPRVQQARYTDRLYFPAHISGSWEECRTRGNVEGAQEYDMISAYGWSGLRDVPAFHTSWPVQKYEGPGIYLVKILGYGVPIIPPHMRIAATQGKNVWVTDEEIEKLDLKFVTVRGLKFAHYWKPGDRIKRVIDAAPERVWKKVLRSYWGVWLAHSGTTCKALKSGKVWTLPNRSYDPISAHYIISRVRLRVADHAPDAAHIFTDAVITKKEIHQGSLLGDWRIKNNFKRVKIKHAGRFDYETTNGTLGKKGVG